jgi:hypothetical protein
VLRADKRIAEVVAAQETEDDEYAFPNTDTLAFEFDLASLNETKAKSPAAKAQNGADYDIQSAELVQTFASRRRQTKKLASASVAKQAMPSVNITPNYPGDDDLSELSKPPATRKSTRFQSDMSTADESIETMMTRLSTVEASLEQVKNLKHEIQDLKKIFIQTLSSKSGSQQPGQASMGKEGQDAGSSNAVHSKATGAGLV